jgi:hypothetical protein
MKFEDIKFYERGGNHPPGLGLHTPGRYWVEKSYFVTAWNMISQACPTGVWYGVQTAESLCCDPTWKDRKDGPRQKLGRCVKLFVEQELLALEEVNKGKGGPRRYRPIKR